MTAPVACPSAVDLEAHAAGGSTRPGEIESHASSCADCRRSLEDMRENLGLLERIHRDFALPSAGGATRLPAIAGFRLIREIGRGGMGVVYEAEQIAPRRRVALKVVRGSQYVDETTLRLFQREIRALARLNHPGIAALHDAGCTVDGEHYFAMELVLGSTLRERARDLPLRERLTLFLRLAEAVDYAHQRGVVHRDLKPSNVLVDERGGVKVLDFGLAKITDQDVAASSLVSEPGALRGTLAYMSPEQAGGDPAAIDLRSDVYSLGVVLYELCTGRLPTDVSNVLLHEAARRIREDRPIRPSGVDSRLRGDLETIVLKALEKEPDRRYPSAAALSEDLRRLLADEPILARAPSALYQVSKLVRRHRLASGLLALIFALAIGTAVWTGILYGRESELRFEAVEKGKAADLARIAESLAKEKALAAEAVATRRAAQVQAQADQTLREARTYQRVRDFLVDVFRASSGIDRTGPPPTADQLFERGLERIDSQLNEDPYVRATILVALGDVCENLGRHSRAETLLAEAVEILRSEAPGQPILAAALGSLGIVRERTGRVRDAIAMHEESLAIHSATDGGASPNALRARNNLAAARKAAGEPETAIGLWREALGQLEPAGMLGGDLHRTILANLGLCLVEQHRLGEAELVLVECVAARRTEGVGLPLADALNSLAMLRMAQERLDEAEELFQESLGIRFEIFGAGSSTLASSYNSLAALRFERGQVRESLEFVTLAREAVASERSEGDPELALYDFNRASAHFQLGEIEQADDLCRRSLEARRTRLGVDHTDTASSLCLHGRILARRGDFEGAERALLEALAFFEASLGRRHPTPARVRLRLAEVEHEAGKAAEAERFAREALADLDLMPDPPASLRVDLETLLQRIVPGPTPRAAPPGNEPR
ncbi:MAG: tetratricopeptide repeat protein [Planctomycetota bacterium]